MSESARETTKPAAVVRQRRTAMYLATALVALGGLFPTWIGLLTRSSVIAVLLTLVLHMLATSATALAWRSWRRIETGKLDAGTRGLFLDGRRLIAREKIRHAHVVRDERGVLVLHVVRKSMLVRSFDVELADEAEGATLLRALRLDARSVIDFELTAGKAKQVTRHSVLALVAWLLCVLVTGFFFFRNIPSGDHGGRLLQFYGVFAVLAGLWGGAMQRINRPHMLSVGTDGVRIRHGKKLTFHPFAKIAGASTNGLDVELRFNDGTTFDLHNNLGGKLGWLSGREREAKLLVERIEEQLAAWRATPVADATTLARNGRKARDWVKDTSEVRESTATFRTNAIPADQLWRIIEDASVPATARAGAAIALRHDLDDGARARLRIAADACAAPHLRVALESVAAGKDDDQLALALDPLDDEGATPSKRMMIG